METTKKKKLNRKQKLFVEEYLIDLNGAGAVRRAGYKSDRPDSLAYTLLRKPEVAEFVDNALSERSKRLQIDADRVMAELAKIAFFDICRVVRIEGTGVKIQNTDDISEDDRFALSEITETESKTGRKSRKVKAHDKLKALELIGRHLAMFTDRVETPGEPNSIIITYRGNAPDAGTENRDDTTGVDGHADKGIEQQAKQGRGQAKVAGNRKPPVNRGF